MDTSVPQGNEIELKLDLGTFANYLKLIGFLGQIDREELHHNTFFDSPQRILFRNGWALRLRLRSADAVLTAKGVSSTHGSASVRQEVEEIIPHAVGTQLLSRSIDLASLPYAPIALLKELLVQETVAALVWFENLRRIRSSRLGDQIYKLELDRTEFADGTVNYELEVELDSLSHIPVAESNVRRVLELLEIPYVVQAMSKFERALLYAPHGGPHNPLTPP